MIKRYMWALDLSLSRTGISVFEMDSEPDEISAVHISSVETTAKQRDGERLKIIGDYLLKLKKKYEPATVVIERGFYRFNKSTQKIYGVHGVVAYLFYDKELVYYPPATVKKVVTGNGGAKKEYLRKYIIEHHTNGDISFANNDESDSFAVGICHLKKKGLIRDG